MILQTEADKRRECCLNSGWHLADDDLPNPPECDPLSSAQSRRAWREAQQAVATES